MRCLEAMSNVNPQRQWCRLSAKDMSRAATRTPRRRFSAAEAGGGQFVVYGDSYFRVPRAIHERNFADVNTVIGRRAPRPDFIPFAGADAPQTKQGYSLAERRGSRKGQPNLGFCHWQ